jgi:hypothetical protein
VTFYKMEPNDKKDTTYKIEGPPSVDYPAPDDSPSDQAPEKLFPNNPE